jgi:hypothetical protein
MKTRKSTLYAIIAILVISAFIIWQTRGFDYLVSDNTAGTLLTITYDNGYKTILNSKAQKLGLAIRLPDTQNAISTIKIEVYVQPTFTGTIQSYTVSGTFNMRMKKILDQSEQQIYDSGNVALQTLSPLPALTSGQTKVISSATITASQLEQLYSGWTNNQQYIIYWSAPTPLSMSITFTDGQVQTRTTGITGVSMVFVYNSASQFTGLAATFWRSGT